MKLIRYRNAVGEAEWAEFDSVSGKVFQLSGCIYENPARGKEIGNFKDLRILAPCEPRKVIALAYNYKDLVGPKDVYDEPLIFFKSAEGIVGPGEPIRLIEGLKDVWVEVEVAFVIKKKAKNISAQEAPDYILGYTMANDVTAENVHGRDWHLARSKSQDTFCPVGPYLDTQLNTSEVQLKTMINGRVTQDGNSRNRILNDFESLSLVSKFFTLMPGDLVLTGTPAGARQSLVKSGDEVRQTITGLGELRNPAAGSEIKKGEKENDRIVSHR